MSVMSAEWKVIMNAPPGGLQGAPVLCRGATGFAEANGDPDVLRYAADCMNLVQSLGGIEELREWRDRARPYSEELREVFSDVPGMAVRYVHATESDDRGLVSVEASVYLARLLGSDDAGMNLLIEKAMNREELSGWVVTSDSKEMSAGLVIGVTLEVERVERVRVEG